MKTLFLDMDNVITDFSGAACDWFNDALQSPRYKGDYPMDLMPEHIKIYTIWENYHLPKGLGESLLKQMFDDPNFWYMAPMTGAINGVKNLCELYNTYIVTAPVWNDVCVPEKIDWIKVHLPFFELERLIFTRDKSILRGDILVDDYWKYLTQFDGRRILFRHSYGESGLCDYIVYNWKQLEELLNALH